MQKIKEIILRAGELLRLFDIEDFKRIPKYKLIYKNDMKITRSETQIMIDNGIFHFNEKFLENNENLLDKVGVYLEELLLQEKIEWENEYDEIQWERCEEKSLQEKAGLFLVLEDGTIYRLLCCDIVEFIRYNDDYWQTGDIAYLCVMLAHKHGVRLEAFGEVPNNYYLYYGIVFDDWYKSRESSYLYDGYDIDVGDFDIVVPYGRNNSLLLGRISSKRYFSYDELPVPLEKMKYIIGRAENCAVYKAEQLYFLKGKRVCIHYGSGELLEAMCLIEPKKHYGEWKYIVPMRIGRQIVEVAAYEIDYIEYMNGDSWECVPQDEQRKQDIKNRRIVYKDLLQFWHKNVRVVCKDGEEYIGKYIWYNSYFDSEPYPESIELEIEGYWKKNIYLQDIKVIELYEK